MQTEVASFLKPWLRVQFWAEVGVSFQMGLFCYQGQIGRTGPEGENTKEKRKKRTNEEGNVWGGRKDSGIMISVRCPLRDGSPFEEVERVCQT